MAELKTMKEFGERIMVAAGVDVDELPHGVMFTWFGAPNGSPTVFRQGEPAPLDPQSRVIALFQNDDAARIYTIALVPPDPKPADWKPKAPARYTFSKLAPTYFVETMTLEVMADEIGDEWSELADGVSSGQRELDAVIEHIEGLDEWVGKSTLIAELQGGLHHGVDGDDEEEGEGELDDGPSDTIPPPPGVAAIVEAPPETPPS
jgi:hypothetical protein